MKGHRALLGFGLIALLSGGCSRSTITTEIRSDGSWKRTAEFTGGAEKKAGDIQNGVPNPMEAMQPALSQTFALPSGPLWKVKREDKKDESVYTAERVLNVGDTLQGDVALKGVEKGKALIQLGNTATVRRLAPGKFEYREVLKWKGERPTADQTDFMLKSADLNEMKKAVLPVVRKDLPAELQTPEDMVFIGRTFEFAFIHMFLGPPEPMLGLLMTVPDYATRRMEAQLARALDTALLQRYGAKLSEASRRKFVRDLFGAVGPSMEKFKKQVKEKSSPEAQLKQDGSKDQTGFVIMTYTVRMPGRVTSSNGIVDDIDNTVTWAFYNVAAAVGDVELTATCEPEQTSRLRFPAKAVTVAFKR